MTPQVLSILEKHYSEGFHLAQLQTFIAALQTSPEKSVTLNFVTNPAAVGRTENKYVDGIFVICSLNYSPPPPDKNCSACFSQASEALPLSFKRIFHIVGGGILF